jgi:hypothetical protein
MAIKRVQKKIDWTPEDRARHKKIRETFQDKPRIEELIDRGELSGQGLPLGMYLNLKLLVKSLRQLRQEANLSLAEVSQRSGMDKAMLSRLEMGHVANPGIGTIARYLKALDATIEWRIVPAPADDQVSHADSEAKG